VIDNVVEGFEIFFLAIELGRGWRSCESEPRGHEVRRIRGGRSLDATERDGSLFVNYVFIKSGLQWSGGR
jgi:hypothetical protein